jgi:uncharacterized membrane protein YkvA (DUF1232 family)
MPRKSKNIELDQKTIAEAVKKAGSRAGAYVRDPAKAKKLLTDAVRKAGDQMPTEGPLVDVWNYLQALFRLLSAYTRQQYTEIPWQSILLVAGAILYFVMPADLIPDFIPAAGLVDDAAVIAFVVARIRTDLDAFMAWETAQTASNDAAGTKPQV